MILLCTPLAVRAQDDLTAKRGNLEKVVFTLSPQVCGVTAPTDAAGKKLYDDQKQTLSDASAGLIDTLKQIEAKLTGSDTGSSLSKQAIDEEIKALGQDCPALSAAVQKVYAESAKAPAQAAPANAGAQQVTVSPAGALDFDPQTIGQQSDAKQVTITNQTGGTTGLTVWYEDLPNFRVSDNTCGNVPVPNQGSCSFKVAFAPLNMDQRGGNITIIPTSGWRDYRGAWSQYNDASRILNEPLASLEAANAKITAVRTTADAASNPANKGKKGKKGKKAEQSKEQQPKDESGKRSSTSAWDQARNVAFCASTEGVNAGKSDPILAKACQDVTGVVNKAQAAKESAWTDIQAKRRTLQENPLAIIPLSGNPNHWKYPLTRAVVGLDLSAVSSQTVRQAYFVDFNLLAPFKFPGTSANEDALESRWWFWLNPRITSLPKAADPSALSTIDEAGTFFTNFSNQGHTADIAQGFDVNGGVEMAVLKPRDGIPWWGEYVNTQARLGISLIAGAGVATPFSTTDADVTSQVNQSICDAFKPTTPATFQGIPVSDPGGLVCTIPSGATSPQVVAGNPAFDPTNPASPKTVNDSFVSFFTPQRSRFFRRYYGGFRLKTYFFSPDVQGECDPKIRARCNAPYDIFPGIIDVTAGQDEAVTKGKLTRVLFRVEGVYPLPFVPGFHIFGSIYTSFKGNAPSQPFNTFTVNTPANGDANDANTFRFPLNPLDRDYFRVGVGVDLIQLLKRNKGGQPTTATSPSSSQTGSNGSSTTSQNGSSGSSSKP